MVTDSWFGNMRFWKSGAATNELVLGILAFEVAGLMSKMVNLWHSLSDREIIRMKEEILGSVGVRRLVSEDDNYLMELALDEIIDNAGCLSRSVIRLSKRCKDPVYHHLEQFYKDPVSNELQWLGWAYRWTKMDRKVKKMERFVALTMQLSQEQDVLVELEQTFRRMQVNVRLDRVKLLEFQQKVMWQHQEVKNLKEMSPWVRNYDYIVRLLARSLFTILERIKLLFGVNLMASQEGKSDCQAKNSVCLLRSHSFSAAMHSSVHPSESNRCGFYSTPMMRSSTKQGINTENNRMHSKMQQGHHQSSIQREKHRRSKSKLYGGPFSGCMLAGSDSPLVQNSKPPVGGSMRLCPTYVKSMDTVNNSNKPPLSLSKNNIYSKLALFNSEKKLLNTRPDTLGGAALSLQYANVIILIEKLASSPHLISLDARDDLYSMLPTTIRTVLRARLKSCAKMKVSPVYNPALGAEWSLALERILEWLAPLAHNTIKWHSERNIEKQHEVSRTNVLLVQTLYYAYQAKTEAAITELLIGLNYICRIGEVNGSKPGNNYILQKGWHL
ncbi:hypothetical protein UlMin_005635 [Ulmus minor]